MKTDESLSLTMSVERVRAFFDDSGHEPTDAELHLLKQWFHDHSDPNYKNAVISSSTFSRWLARWTNRLIEWNQRGSPP